MVLTYDLLEDRRIDDVIIKTFALCYSKMAESLDDILAGWVNEDFEKSLVEAVDSYDKERRKEKERKSRFSVENDLTKLLEQSQSNATKRNTKWLVKLFQGKKPLLCFEINELKKQKLSEIDLFGKKKHSFLNVKIIVYTDWCQERNIRTPLLKMNSKELDQNLARFYVEARTKKGEEYSRSALLGFCNSIKLHLNNNGVTVKITKNQVFQNSNKTLDAKLRINRRAGKENFQHKPVIVPSDLAKIRASPFLSLVLHSCKVRTE